MEDPDAPALVHLSAVERFSDEDLIITVPIHITTERDLRSEEAPLSSGLQDMMRLGGEAIWAACMDLDPSQSGWSGREIRDPMIRSA